MSAPGYCSVCEHPDRAKIDASLRAGTSINQLARTFTVGRTAITGHAMRHTTTPETRKFRDAAKNGRRREPEPRDPTKLGPVESAEDVVADLQRLRTAGFGLLANALSRHDYKSAERLLPQILGVVDRFGDLHKVLRQPGNVTVNIDQRQLRIVELYDALPIDVLRLLKAGEIKIEDVLGQALEVAS
jgi:hypothetical protein